MFTSALNEVFHIASESALYNFESWENLIYYFAKYINTLDGNNGFPSKIPESGDTWLGQWYSAIHQEFTNSPYNEIYEFINNPKCEIIAIELFEAAPMHLQKSFIQYCKNDKLEKTIKEIYPYESDTATSDSDDLPDLVPIVPENPEKNNNIKLNISYGSASHANKSVHFSKFNVGTKNNKIIEQDLKTLNEKLCGLQPPLQGEI